MMRRLLALVLFVLAASYAEAANETILDWGLSAGSEPRSMCVYDTTGNCAAVGLLNSTTHAFSATNITITGGTTPVIGSCPAGQFLFNNSGVIGCSGSTTAIVGGTTPITGTCPAGQFIYNNAGIVGCSTSTASLVGGTTPITGTCSNGQFLFDSSGVVACSSSSTNLVGGTTPVSGTCPSTQFLYNNAGTLGCQSSSVTFTQPAGSGGIAQSITAKATGNEIYPDDYGTVDRTGASDMGALLNTTIANAKNCFTTGATGNSTVRLRAGTYLITTPIVPLSCVTIVGDGPGKTILLTNSNTPVVQTSGTQVVHFNMRGLTFKDSGGHASATVLGFTTIQGSRIENIRFRGYTSGTIMSINPNGAAVSSYDDTQTIWHNANSTFNVFSDWVAENGAANGISLAGYSTANCNTAAITQVVTQNQFNDITFYGITGVALNFVRAADSNYFRHVTVFFNGSGATANNAHPFKNVGIQMGDENATCTGNNDVAYNRIQISLSNISPATSATIFNSGNFNFANRVDLITDIATSALSIHSQPSVSTANNVFEGSNYSTFEDPGSGNIVSLRASQGEYLLLSNGSSTNPIFGFINDASNGTYLRAASVAAFTKTLQVNTHFAGGTSVPSIASGCGSGPSVIGNDVSFRVSPGTTSSTTCSVNYGTAYTTAPICVASPFSALVPGLFIASISTTALTLNYNAGANLAISVHCIGRDGG